MGTSVGGPTPRTPTPTRRIGLLGPFRVWVGGDGLDIGRPKAKLVLARLALSASPVPADALIDSVWGDVPPATARKNLQKYVSELRKALGTDAVRTEGSGYSYGGDRDEVDVLRFRKLVDDARSARAEVRHRRAWELLEDALGLWRGAALDGMDPVAFVVDETRRLEEARLGAVEDQMELGLMLGKHESLVVPLENLVFENPFRERLWGALMTALYRCGRQADALDAARRVRTLLRDELGIDPSPELTQVEQRILVHDPKLLETASIEIEPGNLPSAYTSFVGRSKEVSQVTRLLSSERLVVIAGPGGSGKTRLSIEVATTLQSAHPDGIWFVDLAPVDAGGHVIATTASAVGLVPEPATPLDHTLYEYFRGRKALLIVDNCEHVREAAAAMIRAILEASPTVTVLATTRETLGLTGERIYQLGPLATPKRGDARHEYIAGFDSVRLFVDRAVASDPSFRLDQESSQLVAGICRRLEGLPLAIELAARQLHLMGLSELCRRLTDHLDLLVAPGEPAARHRTMEAAIDWSYRSLDERERRVFDALFVFPGSFTAEAVDHVCRDTGIEVGTSTAAIVTRLVASSMLVRQVVEDGSRYRMLEPIRAFARSRAKAEGTEFYLARAHAQWVLSVLREQPHILGPNERERARRVAQEHHHFPAALRWSSKHDPELALELLAANSEFILLQEFRFSWVRDLFKMLEITDEPASQLRAEALAYCALALAENFADYPTARSWAEKAVRAATEAGSEHLIAVAEVALTVGLRSTGLLGEARTRILHAIDVFDEERDLIWSARALHWLGHVELGRGAYPASIAATAEAAALWKEAGSDWGRAKALWLTAAAQAALGDHADAEASAAESVELLKDFDDVSTIVHVRAAQGDAARLSGQFERAEAIYRECLTGFQSFGDRRCTASSLKNLGLVALRRGRPDEGARLLIAALERRSQLGEDSGIPECLEGLALVADESGRGEVAIRLLAAAATARARSGATAPQVEREEIDRVVARYRETLPKDRFNAMWEAGSNLGPPHIVDEVHELFAHAPVRM